MNKLNLKNEILTSTKMKNVKGGATWAPISDPRPKPPPGGAKPGGIYRP